MSELASVQSDSGRADPRTVTTWPGAEVAQWTICLPSTPMVHWQTFTVNGFKWEMVVCQIPLFLQSLMPTGTRIATCRLTRAGTASWVDFTDSQWTLTAACSCWACRSILHDIQCSSKRHAIAHCHCDVAWDLTVVDEWTAWPFDFEDHTSLVSHSDLTEANKLPPCCPVML